MPITNGRGTVLKKLLLATLFLVALLSGVHSFLVTRATLPIATNYQDTQIFVQAAESWKKTGTLYSMDEPLETTYAPAQAVYKFPPTYVLPYLPFLNIFADAKNNHDYKILFALHLVRYLVVLGLVVYFLGPRQNPVWQASAFIIFMLASPVYESLYGMTFENLLFFILALSLVLLRYRHHHLVALILSYACLAKIYPAPQLLFFINRRYWKILFGISVAAIGWLVLSLLVIGVEPFRVYITQVLPVILSEKVVYWSGNVSLLYTMLPAGLFRAAAIVTTILVTLAIVNYDQSGEHPKNVELAFGFVTAEMVLLIPNCWTQYQIVLLLPIVILVGNALMEGSTYAKFKLVLAIAAWLPMLVSENYYELNLPYYSHELFRHTPLLGLLEVLLSKARLITPLLVWAGLGMIIYLEGRKPQVLAAPV